MIWAIIASLLEGVSTIFEKRGVELNNAGPTNVYMMTEIGTFFLAIITLSTGLTVITFSQEFIYGFLFALGSILTFPIATLIKQNCYRKEKISVLQPYDGTKEIFGIILGFFYSLITLLIHLL